MEGDQNGDFGRGLHRVAGRNHDGLDGEFGVRGQVQAVRNFDFPQLFLDNFDFFLFGQFWGHNARNTGHLFEEPVQFFPVGQLSLIELIQQFLRNER